MNDLRPTLELVDEDALVEQVQRGDLQAFAPLLDHHLPHVRAFLALRTPAPHLVDELAHETFVHAFRHLDDFVSGTSFAAWLRGIAWNLLRAEILRFSREQANHARYAHERRLALAQDNREPASSPEVEFLEQCLERLPAAMRELVELKYDKGYSADEIARRFQRSTAWVWTMLFRVRRQLKECIEGKLGKKLPC